MFSHSRASTAANTRILRTFTLTGDEQGILGGFFRVLVNTIEIHGGDHLLVQTDVAGDHTPAARIWYSLLQSVCDNASADDVLLSLAPLVSHLDLSPIESAEQHERVISKLVHSLPETLRTNMFDHSFRCGGCGKLSHHTLLNFLQFDTSGTAVLNFNINPSHAQCARLQVFDSRPAPSFISKYYPVLLILSYQSASAVSSRLSCL